MGGEESKGYKAQATEIGWMRNVKTTRRRKIAMISFESRQEEAKSLLGPKRNWDIRKGGKSGLERKNGSRQGGFPNLKTIYQRTN